MPPRPAAAARGTGGAGGGASVAYYGGAAVIAIFAAGFAAHSFFSPIPVPPACGDGLCGWDESGSSCPQDCTGSCGDGFCGREETCSVFAKDPLFGKLPGVMCEEDCGQCDSSFVQRKAMKCASRTKEFSLQHNSSLLWGTYRPHLFCGLRTRSPTPLLVGLMWHVTGQLETLRYQVTSNGIPSYRWVEHDGRSYGHQTITDATAKLQINTTFVKHLHDLEKGHLMGGDWTLRVSVGHIGASSADSKRESGDGRRVSLVLNVAAAGKHPGVMQKIIKYSAEERAEYGEERGEGPFVAFQAWSASTAAYAMSVFARRRLGDGGTEGVDAQAYYYLDKAKQEDVDSPDAFLSKVYIAQRKIGETSTQLPDAHMSNVSNVAFLQVDVPVGSEVDFVFTSFKANGLKRNSNMEAAIPKARELTGLRLDSLIALRSSDFHKKFEETFKLGDAACHEPPNPVKEATKVCDENGKFGADAVEFGKYALSQMLGGLSYHSGSWYRAEPPYYNSSSEVKGTTCAFSATPCRDGRARGSLWDEGFHQLLIARWDPSLTKDAILHWLDVMQADGWIPRKLLLGSEPKEPDPNTFQMPFHANPPTLLLALEALIDSGEVKREFVACVLPRLEVWLRWFKRTQRAQALHSYRWQGRVLSNGVWHTVASGMTDYPRTNSSSSRADRHVDVTCWVAVMHRILAKAEKIVKEEEGLGGGGASSQRKGAEEEVGGINHEEYLDKLVRHLDVVHWDAETGIYADRGHNQHQFKSVEEGFAQHVGYVALFPLLLQLIRPGDASARLIQVMSDEAHLLSRAGLRSLSPSSPFSGGGKDTAYGTQEDLWRGKVWININYLALQALSQRYSSQAGAKELYQTLRASIISTLLSQWKTKGYLFEQYSDKTGAGLKSKPFTGWSALVLLIMAEQY